MLARCAAGEGWSVCGQLPRFPVSLSAFRGLKFSLASYWLLGGAVGGIARPGEPRNKVLSLVTDAQKFSRFFCPRLSLPGASRSRQRLWKAGTQTLTHAQGAVRSLPALRSSSALPPAPVPCLSTWIYSSGWKRRAGEGRKSCKKSFGKVSVRFPGLGATPGRRGRAPWTVSPLPLQRAW
ncbi:hypothetical protein NDU88_004702 [Pleurodeles waltl]|uniref:Uncharacterized protein n=1 Tax=Pleurodeles waltl TaxID=8319 RepID=A0AAV7VJI6_PLEWA|nr:hypothetical protein NDU88_004702 [Pleurodeles waltl]